MEKATQWLSDSCRQVLTAVSERNATKLDEILAAQRERATVLDPDAQRLLLASLAKAQLLATLQRAHVLEAVKDCKHQLAVLQGYQQNCA